MSNNPPKWIVDRATETADVFSLPFHQALQVELYTALDTYGYPLPENDPRKEAKRKQAVQNQRVLDP